jgi:glyoxylase-like metal-dependent hydrolase (beta-lactamase superfamily II)
MSKNRIIPIVLGELEADKSSFCYLCFAGEKIRLEVCTFYIEGPGKNILIDTGSYADLMARYWPGPGKDLQTFEEGLESVGLKPKDIDIVIYTHLHHDHCGYHSKVIQAEAWVQEDEWAYAMSPHPLHAQWYPRELYRGWKVKLIKGDCEVTGGVKILHTPGHTPGTQSVAVETDRGLAIIAGACTIWDTFKKPADILPEAWKRAFDGWEVFPPTIATNLEQAYWSNLRVKTMADFVIPVHGGPPKPLRQIRSIPPEWVYEK